MNLIKQSWVLGLLCMVTCFQSTLRANEPAKKDIVDTAVGAGNFDTLATALKAADLVGTLKGKGPFTVFAPTDEAFKKIPKEKLNALLMDKQMLSSILTYHVVPGKVQAADVVKKTSVKTVQGKSISISAKDGTVKLNGVNVTRTDIICSNGVIHVIDAVLIPPADNDATQSHGYEAKNNHLTNHTCTGNKSGSATLAVSSRGGRRMISRR